MRRLQLFNRARVVVLAGLLFTILGAGVFRTPPILFLASVLCGAPLIGSWMGRIGQKSVRLTRTMPDAAMVGDKVRARLVMENTSRLPLLLIHSRAGELTIGRESSARRAGGDEGWRDFVTPLLGAGEQTSWQWEWKLRRRGVHHFSPASAGTIDPLGLYNRLTARTSPHEITILPRPLKLNRLGWVGGASGGAMAPMQSSRVADALDFRGVRPHLPGEGLRRVHWKSTARTGVLHVIEWEEEMASDLTIVLDTQASVIARAPQDVQDEAEGTTDHEWDTLECAITGAASVAAYLLENGYQVQVLFFEPDARQGFRLSRYEARHRGALGHLLQVLAVIEPVKSPEANLGTLVQQARRLVVEGRSLLIMSTDLADVEGALSLAAQRSAPRPQALIFESKSFQEAVAPKAAGADPGAAKKGPFKRKIAKPASGRAPRPGHESEPGQDWPRGVRYFRCEESLAAALEKGA